jgi:MFS family permease
MLNRSIKKTKSQTRPFSPASLWAVVFLDHFDLVLYTGLLPLWGVLFFPTSTSALHTASTIHGIFFATRSLAYPLASLLFGWLATRFSPPAGLRLSVLGFSVSTLAMGLIPTAHDNIFWGPIFFALCRFLQCFFARGERTITPLYLLDRSPENKAMGRIVIAQVMLFLGNTAAQAASLFLLLPSHQKYWRIAFLMAGIVGCAAAWLRWNSISMPEKTGNAPKPDSSDSQTWSWSRFIALASITGPTYTFYAFAFYLMSDFVPLITDISNVALMKQKTYFFGADIVVLIGIHWTLKKYKPGPNALIRMMRGLCVLSIATLPLFFYGIVLRPSLGYVGCLQGILILIGVTYALCFFTILKQNLNETNKPYLFMGGAQMVGTITLGYGTAFISLLFYKKTGWACSPGLYGSFVCAVAWWGLGWMKKNGAANQISPLFLKSDHKATHIPS